MEEELTGKQQLILDFIKKYIKKRGYPPSLRDICDFIGIKAPKNAAKHLEALEKKGYIEREPGRARAIEVVNRAAGPGESLSTVGWQGQEPYYDERTVPVPMLGQVRAGLPHLAVEDIEGYIRLDTQFFKAEGAFILRTVGDSMHGAGIDDGDLLLVRPQRTASSGEIVVAMIDGEATVKRLFIHEGGVTLEPENQAFETIEVNSLSDFAIVGKVVTVIKEF